MKRILTIVLCLFFVILTGCNGKENSPINNAEIGYTNIDLFRNGTSNYQVVLPEKPLTNETTAASELLYFFKEATGYSLSVVSDKDIKYSDKDFNISIGKTSLLENSGIYLDNNKLGKSGYIIKRKNNTIFLVGAEDNLGYGTLYATYDFLQHQLDYKQYSSDEYSLKRNVNYLALRDFDLSVTPFFDTRELGFGVLKNNANYKTRMKLTMYGDENWASFSHSNNYIILPYSLYGALHPEWYTQDGSQLCFSNEEMRKEFVKQTKYWLERFPSSTYYMMGQGDNPYYCTCNDCQKALKRCGTQSGIQIEFANKVVRETKEWLKETNPNRKVTFCVFAYQYTESPPVKIDEKGNIVPFSDVVLPDKDLAIMWAPIGVDYQHDYSEEENRGCEQTLKEWSCLTDSIFAYSYSTNYADYLINFDNLGSVKANYDLMKKYGINYIYDSGPLDASTCTMEELRIFLQSQLMWDNTQDVTALVNEFMLNYYKDANEEMLEYYNLIRTQQNLNAKLYDLDGKIYTKLGEKKYWQQGFLQKCLNTFDKAKEKVSKYKNNNPHLYNLLSDRISKESISTRYLMLRFYNTSYSQDELAKMVNEFEKDIIKFGILSCGESKDIYYYINQWK